MSKVRSAIEDAVPISMLNKGYAGQIFEEVRKTGAKVVMKNNTPECVLISPEDYLSLLNELNELRAAAKAALRLEQMNPKELLSESDFRSGGAKN